MAAAVATVTTMLFTWIRYKKPDVSMSLNGTLAGLVMVTASTDCIDMYGAAIEGIIAGIAVVLVIEFIDKVCKVDDPVGAVGVHFCKWFTRNDLCRTFLNRSERCWSRSFSTAAALSSSVSSF